MTTQNDSLQFRVAADRCTGCGLCVQDCLAHVLSLEDRRPAVVEGREESCYRCQHCLSVCPTGAVSIFGLDPADSQPILNAYPDRQSLEALILGRRSFRRYRQTNVDRALLDHLLDVAWAAPTGSNRREVAFTLIDDVTVMERFRTDLMTALVELDRAGGIPESHARFGAMARAWDENRTDTLFRNATHFLVATAPADVPSGLTDCVIALTTFDLLAQASGLGTVWDGLAKAVLNDLLPAFKTRLGIPEDHALGHAIAFGVPAIHYARTVQRGKPPVNRVG